MIIRHATDTDCSAVASLVRGLSHFYLEDSQADLPEWFEVTLTDSSFANRFNDADYANFVAEREGEIIGYLSIKTGFHLYHCFVASDYHQQGIATALWRHAVETLNISYCTVRSSLYAVPVYSRFGFQASGNAATKDGIGYQPMVFGNAIS